MFKCRLYSIKSLLNLSENFHKAKKDFNNQGIEIEGIKLNIEKMMSTRINQFRF